MKLLTAPYVVRRNVDGRRVLVRTDPQRRARSAVAATPLVEAVLAAGAAGRERAELVDEVAGHGAHPVEQVEAAVDTLTRQELLLRDHELYLLAPSIELEVTNRCNADCLMCPRSDLRPLGTMPEPTFERVAQLVAGYPCQGVILQGIGEPTLDPRLVERVARLRGSLGAGQPIVVVTNGFRMRPELLGALRAAGLTYVQWSFHSTDPQVYGEIMGADRFDVARRNLRDCAVEHAAAMFVNAVVMRANHDAAVGLRRMLADAGIDPGHLRLIPVFSRGGFVAADRLGVHGPRQAAGRCLYVKRSMFVAWNGDILPCANDISGQAVLGNVSDLEPDAVLRQWQDDLVAEEARFPMCVGCDHHLRGGLATSWFSRVPGMPVDGRDRAHGEGRRA